MSLLGYKRPLMNYGLQNLQSEHKLARLIAGLILFFLNTMLFKPATLERYHVRFDGFSDIIVDSIGAIEAIATARGVLMRDRGVRKPETLASGRVTYVESL